ncbi:MAG: hypothetical protein UT08_C0011G0065 [Candidatus Woesebacteria bacterium GW2011_GWB1_38_8]|uniref:Uncharacterized protein n=1 Tax=Candidatus Woesebacteria bacterium GW2011_GWB1_38_8 TaxID=1618570 RepID=A0A0G0L233_9BACT|nr:MAG: hypothetical protein UT08_C0011G0065 [Candidatus Woesebacteria bacterium GW2011_GWB1_38_8]
MDESSNTSTQQVRTPNLEPFFNVGIPDPVKFIDVVVREAITLGASDIFFEPEKDELRVRWDTSVLRLMDKFHPE